MNLDDVRALLPTMRDQPLLLGFDSSESQGRLDMQAMAKAFDFGLFKATDGRQSVDEQWANSFAAARDVDGWTWGAYGVIEPYGEAVVAAQVENFVKNVQGSGAEAWVCDFELAAKITAKAALRSARAWMQGVSAALGQAGGMLYGGESFLDGLEQIDKGDPELQEILADLSAWPFWGADYRASRRALGGPAIPHGWSDWTLWQIGPFSDGATPPTYRSTVPGTRVGLDLNIFRGDVAALRSALSLPCASGASDPSSYQPTSP